MSNALLLIEKLRALGADSAFADDNAPLGYRDERLVAVPIWLLNDVAACLEENVSGRGRRKGWSGRWANHAVAVLRHPDIPWSKTEVLAFFTWSLQLSEQQAKTLRSAVDRKLRQNPLP